MQLPLVSIMIPNYNYAKYLPEAIKSACTQDYNRCEVIVVDNVSSDNSIEVLETLQKDHDFTVVRNTFNLGMTRNWQKCISLASGKYFMWLSSDDVLESDFISSCVKVLEKHENCAFAATDRINMDMTGQNKRFRFYSESGIIPGLAQAKVFLFANPFVPSHVLLRKSSVENVYGITYPRLFDWELWFTLCLHYDIAYLDKPGVMYRLHSESASTDMEEFGQLTMERYMLLKDFLGQIKHIPELYCHRDAAYAKIADNALLYAYRFLVKSNFSAAMRYLYLAQIGDSTIEGSQIYKDALAFIRADEETRITLLPSIIKNHSGLERVSPYPLPEGSKVLNEI